MTLKELSKLDGRVYIHLSNSLLATRFMEQAEKEGFSFADGVKPTMREAGSVMALNPDMTLNYIGFIGMMVYGAKGETVGGKKIIRVDFSDIEESLK